MIRSHLLPRWTARLAILAVAVGVIAGPAAPAAADLRDRLEEQLRAVDEGLRTAREIVLESRSARGREVLEHAAEIQTRAWEEFRAERWTLAARLARQAGETGRRAVTLARADATLAGRAQRELEQGVAALSEAREAFDASPPDVALRLLNEARAQLERGRAQFQEANYETAIRLAVSARSLVKQALGSDASAGSEAVLRELERTDRLMERIGELVRDSGGAEAERLFDQARSLQDAAWTAQREGRLRMAFSTTREARAVAGRAAGQLEDAVKDEAIDDALAETDRLLESAAEILRESGSEPAGRLLENAREHQARARDFAAGDQLREALAETRVARGLAKRALRLAEDPGAE